MKIFNFKNKKLELSDLEKARQLNLITELEKLEIQKQRATTELLNYQKRTDKKGKK